jgi:hypothetical protein
MNLHTMDGRTQTLREWAGEAGISYHVLRSRIHKQGKPLAQAMAEPVIPKRVAEHRGLQWSTANAKLRKLGTVSFGLPAGVAADGFNTCPAKGICAGLCFARQGYYVMPWVAATREANLRIARGSPDVFEALAVRDLTKLAGLAPRARRGGRNRERPWPRTVRVHDSGDFFSLAYLCSWYAIAERLPQLRFYAFTKSLGGLHDDKANRHRPVCRIFLNHAEREQAGYVDGSTTDAAAIRGEKRIGIVFHSSNRPLTPAQRNALRVIP